MSIWDNQESLRKLGELRAGKRARSDRLTFDCFHLKYRDDRAYCDLGKRLGRAQDGFISLLMVLRGMTSGACKNCEDFTTEEE